MRALIFGGSSGWRLSNAVLAGRTEGHVLRRSSSRTPVHNSSTSLSSSPPSSTPSSHVSSRRKLSRLCRYVPVVVLFVPRAHISSAGRRTFSQSAARHSYEDTIKNLLINKDTKVLCQGLTGKTVCDLQRTPLHSNPISLRARARVLSTSERLLRTAPTWSVVFRPKRPDRLTWVCPSLAQ